MEPIVAIRFNTLRERFEQVTAVSTSTYTHLTYVLRLTLVKTRAQYERELAVANDKIKKLENECK